MLTGGPSEEGLLRAQLLESSQCSIEQVGSRADSLASHLLMFLGKPKGPLHHGVQGGSRAAAMQEEAFSSS